MSLIEDYQRYRQRAMDLGHKMIEACLDRVRILNAARRLGMVGDNDVLVSSGALWRPELDPVDSGCP